MSDVQTWLDSPATNFGWIVIGKEQALTTAKRFGSREGTPVLRPSLTVTYCLPRGACGLPSLALPFQDPQGFGLPDWMRGMFFPWGVFDR